jgi:Zn ribbon nucleic-acid-binding protein
MPVYRLETFDEPTREVSAARVLAVDGDVRFQTSVAGQWRLVHAVALEQVRRVQRRYNEADGRLRWVDERDINDAAGAVREAEGAAVETGDDVPAPSAAAARVRGETSSSPPPVATPPPAVSAADVRCPSCGEQEELTGRRSEGQILLHCLTCGYDGPRTAARRCRTCGGDDVVERPKALVERARGTQLSVVGYSTVALCRTCDADDLARAIQHGGAVLPKELPTVDPTTLAQLRPDRADPTR